MEEMLPGFGATSRGIKRRTEFLKEVCKVIESEE
jgi:hypothetical protein